MAHPTPAEMFTPLETRPEATTTTVRALIQKVALGHVRVPRFQRPLRWTQADVIKLLDSVWRGYPIGSLLFWKRPADKETIRVGGAPIEAPHVDSAWWVVDGQQRVTALAASLLDLSHGADQRWVVRFDPESEQFLPGPPPPERDGIDVPVSILGDLRRLGRWIRDADQLSTDLTNRVERAQVRILDYEIPAYIVETNDEQGLRAVFARLNSTGARMRSDEVFQALLGAPAGVGKATLDLDELQRQCDLDNFGVPSRADILKSALAMSGHDPTRRLEELGELDRNRLVSREDAVEALTRTVRFLVSDCGVPHVSLIPYPVVFFILARWFHIHPASSEVTRRTLARWLWRGAITGTHQRAEVSRMREQIRAIEVGDEQGSLDRLLRHVAERQEGPWKLTRFHLRSARSRIETLTLLAQEPQELLGPVSIAELVSAGRIAREIFRSSDWGSLGEEDRELARSAANRVVLGTTHTGLSAELKTWRRGGIALESHLIDEQAHELLVSDEIGAFLRHRGECVRAAVETFVTKRAAWQEPLLRPIEHYFEAADGE